MTEPSQIISLILMSNLAAAGGVLGVMSVVEGLKRRRTRRVKATQGEAIYLFSDEHLVDASATARHMLKTVALPGTDWQKFVALYSAGAPTLRQQMAHLVEQGQITIRCDNGGQIKATWLDGIARIAVIEPDAPEGDGRLAKSIALAAQREAQWLRDTLNTLPAMVWHEDEAGNLLWANDNYLSRANQIAGIEAQSIWPPARIFHVDTDAIPDRGTTQRMNLPQSDGEAWFDVHAQPFEGRIVYTATSAERVVAAEKRRRDFVQTLTKTFSHLSFGLAVFDKSRRLGLFNSALTQMTHIDAEFLAARPSLSAFLDHLREKRVIPEPRDYAAWRAEVTDAALAPNGCYDASWVLASGQTYHVCGRAHADGSFALTLEDISKEVSLTRRHRNEIELAQAALDSIEDPVAGFDEAGALTLTNQAFDQMWSIDPRRVLGQMTILDLVRIWQSKSLPSQMWGELRDLISGHEPRAEWSANVTLLDGSVMNVRINPAVNGSTMVIFSKHESPVVSFETHRRREALPVN
ncbi:MAG: PAS-domain containing protein [Deltaproteobacteria bacterium]